MSDIAVSIIVPVCNVERFLPECLESLIGQTMRNIEIICIDDGSTDSSLSILRDYERRDKRIRVISKPNSGYGHTMNVGLDIARGEYIGIVESDDKALPEMFERLYSVAQSHACDVVKSNFNYYTNGELRFYENHIDIPYDTVFVPRDLPEIFETSMSIWSAIYKRSFLVSNNIRFHESPGASYQDVSFNLRALLAADSMLCIKDAFLCYRFDNSGSSVYSRKKVFCIIDEFDIVDDFIRTRGYDQVFPYMMAVKYRHFLEHYDRVHLIYKYAFLDRMKTELVSDNEAGLIIKDRFRDYVWTRIEKILSDPEAFFQDENREYIDLVDYAPYCMNASLSEKGWKTVLEDSNKIVIYGAGAYGKRFYSELNNDIKEKVSGFAVTKISENDADCIDNLPVKSIMDYLPYRNNILVVVAIKKDNQMPVLKNLYNLGFQKVLSYPCTL